MEFSSQHKGKAFQTLHEKELTGLNILQGVVLKLEVEQYFTKKSFFLNAIQEIQRNPAVLTFLK